MTVFQLLEDFSHSHAGPSHASVSEDTFEDIRLAAFEKGYQAGWDDAAKALADDQRYVSADLARNLQDLSFTYHEALTHVTTSLEPLLQRMVHAVLPVAAQQSLGVRIVSEVMDMVKDRAEGKLILTMSPESRTRLEPLFQSNLPMPAVLRDDDSLGQGQVFLKFDQDERNIDLDGLIKDIEAALTGFFEANTRQSVDG